MVLQRSVSLKRLEKVFTLTPERLRQFNPAIMELIDGALFETVVAQGSRYQFYSDASENGNVAAVVYIEFDDIRLVPLEEFLNQDYHSKNCYFL